MNYLNEGGELSEIRGTGERNDPTMEEFINNFESIHDLSW